jgi:hypothetical protein
MPRGLMRTTIIAGALLDACAPAPVTSLPRANCGAEPSDSSRAVCLALDTLARGFQLPSRVLTVDHLADTFRIRTVPADSTTLDGMGLVVVGPGAVVRSALVSDSL